MCGIVGLLAKQAVNQGIYDALTVLQHRGQDAAGMMTWNEGRFLLRKSNGLVRDVFHTRHMARLKGNLGIGMFAIRQLAPPVRQNHSLSTLTLLTALRWPTTVT